LFNVSFLVSVVNKNRIRTRRRPQQAVNDTRSFSRTLEGATNRTDIESVKRLRIGGERTNERTNERRNGQTNDDEEDCRLGTGPRPSAHSLTGGRECGARWAAASAKSRPVGKFQNPSSSLVSPPVSLVTRPSGWSSFARPFDADRPNGRVESLTGRVSDARPRPVRPPVSWPS
jgi:hypothetical protein